MPIARERHNRNELTCPYCEAINDIKKDEDEVKCKTCDKIFLGRRETKIVYSSYSIERILKEKIAKDHAQKDIVDLARITAHNGG